MNEVKLRIACPADAPALLKIYAPYVENTAITFEYSIPSEEDFAERIANIQRMYPYLVAECGGEPIGYAYASSFKARAAYDWTVETSIYVRMDMRRCGIGAQLYQKLEQLLCLQHITNANACITYPNPQSIAFHEKLGYRKAAHFSKCGFKLGKWHDVVWMEKILQPHNPQPLSVVSISEVKFLI